MANLLPSTISSRHDLTALLLDIESYATWYAQYANATSAKVAYTKPQPELSETALELIRLWSDAEPLTQARIDELIDTLRTIHKTAPVITITLAAPAQNSIKQSLVDWCRTNIHPDVLVSFGYNRTILGGMIVRTGSAVHDWSFRRLLLSSPKRFTEVLNHV